MILARDMNATVGLLSSNEAHLGSPLVSVPVVLKTGTNVGFVLRPSIVSRYYELQTL